MKTTDEITHLSLPPLGPPPTEAAFELSTLRLPLDLRASGGLASLRAARRAMIREEWTLGLDDEEPSLLDAEFSLAGVVWDLPRCQEARGRAKLAALVRRARALEGGPLPA